MDYSGYKQRVQEETETRGALILVGHAQYKSLMYTVVAFKEHARIFFGGSSIAIEVGQKGSGKLRKPSGKDQPWVRRAQVLLSAKAQYAWVGSLAQLPAGKWRVGGVLQRFFVDSITLEVTPDYGGYQKVDARSLVERILFEWDIIEQEESGGVTKPLFGLGRRR